MKGFWESATFLRGWTLLALEIERQQPQQMKAVVGWDPGAPEKLGL